MATLQPTALPLLPLPLPLPLPLLSLSLFRLGLESFLIGFRHGFDLYGTKDNFEHDTIASLQDRVSAEGVASLGNLGQWRG